MNHAIHVTVSNADDVDLFDDLTKDFHQNLDPAQQTYSITGTGDPHRFLSRDGFLENLREMAQHPPAIVAAAHIDQPWQKGTGMECLASFNDGPQ